MSRAPVRTSGGPPPSSEEDETCPVCKTTRYFNRDMEFRVNPECYHRMCKTCVERIFRDGPAQCPYAGCHKTLRLRGFKSAFFGDLGVEREVDIRRRVAAVFNKVEDDFETLDDYNEYLYVVECLTSDMVSGGAEAKKEAEAKLADYEAQHKAEIERNRRLARESDDARQKRVAAEEEAARQRRMQDMQDEADQKASAARFREEMLDSLQSAEAGRAGETVDRILLKKRGAQKKADALAAASSGLSIRGLKGKKEVPEEEKGPYDPFGGRDMTPTRVDVSKERLGEYRSEWVDIIRTRDDYTVGGYSPAEYLGRALFDVVAGLGVFVADDKAEGERAAGTAVAAEGVKMEVDEV